MSRLKAKLIVHRLKRQIRAIKKAGFSISAMRYITVSDRALFSNLAEALKCPIIKKQYYNYSELTFNYSDLAFCNPIEE